MFASAGGGGKRIGSNKQNQQQQSQIQTHQHPTHPQPHQLLQQHQAQQQQQQQLQNNPLVHHNRQTPPQTATNTHPLQHSHTQQQQQQQQQQAQQQTLIVQHQQKPPPPVAHQPQQFQPHPQFPLTFLGYPFSNVHAAAASGQHRPVQSAIGTNTQISPSPTNLVCSSNDTINGNRPTGTMSTSIPHYMSQTTNSHLMTPSYHLQLQQNATVMVASQYNNVAAASTAGTGTNQLTSSSAAGPAAFYQTRQQTQTPPAQQQQQQQGLLNTQHAFQYFQNSSVPIQQLQHHPPQQIRNMNMIAMVAPPSRQPFIMSPNYYALAPQALTTAAPPQHQSTAQGVPAVAVNTPSVATPIQNAPQRSAILAGPTAYVPAPYCAPPLQLGSAPTSLNMPPAGVMESNTPSNHTNTERKKPRIHAVAIIDPDTGKEIDIESKKEATTSTERIEAANSSETCNEEVVETQPTPPPQQQPQNQDNSHLEVVFESTSVQTEDDNSLTASTVSGGCSEVTQPTMSETERKDKEVQTPDTEISDHDVHDEVDSSYTDKHYHPEEEETNLDIVSEYEEGQLEVNILTEEEEKNMANNVAIMAEAVPVPDIHIATTAVSSNCQSGDSGTESLKICLYEDPNDTDADANEHELDNEDDVVDLDIAKVKEIEDKPTSCVDDDNSCTPNKSNDDVKTSETNVIVQKQGRNSKKGAKHFKKNKKKSKQQQQQQQQQQKTSETIKNSSITTNRNSNSNTSTNANDNAKSSTTSAIDNNNKIQSEQLSEQNENNLPTIESLNSSSNKSQKQKFIALETKGDLKKDTKSKNRSVPNLIADKKRFIRYTLEELKAMARSEESNKTPIVPCQKGGCIAQLFVARQQQQHFHHSLSLTSSSNQNISNVGSSLSQHHNMNTAGNKIYRINLSLKEEVKLSRSKNAWQPKVLRRKSDNNNVANAEQELKKVRGILNKLTFDNFQVLVKSMKDISLDGQDNIEKVMLLIFEKTVSEPNFAQIYAKFCHVLFQEIKPDSKQLFNTLLIHRLQTEFENNVNNPNAKNDTLQHITDKLKKTKDPKEKLELTNEYDVEEYKFRRRAWGTVRFIGEMYKLNGLTSDRALLCLESLLNNGNEEKLEYLCKLLITVGPQLDADGTVARLNDIFHKIQNIVTEAKSDVTKQKIKISSRVRFMLQDVIDLRSRHWDLKPATSNAPTAMRPAAQQQQQQQQHKNNHSSTNSNINLNNYERVNQRMNYGNNHRQGRNSMHNNNNNMKDSGVGSNSGGGHFAQKAIDIKKLNFSKGVDESSLTNTKLGNSSIYRWRNEAQQSGRNTPTSLSSNAAAQKLQQTTSYSQQQQPVQHHSSANGEVKSQSSHTDIQKILNSYSAEDNKKLLNHLLEEYLDCLQSRSTRWQEEIFKTWQKTTQIQQICVIYYILMEYLHLARVKQLERSACSNIFMYIMRFGPFNKKTFARAYEQFAEDFPDVLTDVPNGWSYIFEFLGPILHERLLTFDDIWSNTWRNDKAFTERFFKALVMHFTKEFGANYMRNMWHNECQFYYKQLFTTEQHLRQFVEANKFQFIFDRNVKPEFSKTTSTSVEEKVQRLETLLNSADNSNLALDYINTNVNVNCAFLKQLTSFLCCDFATTMQATTAATASSHTVSNKNSSTCSSSSGSNNSGIIGGRKSLDLKTPQLNVNLFREKCMPVLRLCLDNHEDHEITCLDAIVESMLQEYDVYSAYNLICNIFDLLYDGELIPKESFDKWYRQWHQQQQQHHQQSADGDAQLQAFMQKILL